MSRTQPEPVAPPARPDNRQRDLRPTRPSPATFDLDAQDDLELEPDDMPTEQIRSMK